jgi:hypothetical protein
MITFLSTCWRRNRPVINLPDGYLVAVALNLFAVLIMLVAIVSLTLHAQAGAG